MATVVNIGSSSTIVSGQITIAVGAGGVPVGATVFVCCAVTASGASGSIADTGFNIYSIFGSKTNNNSSTNGTGFLFAAAVTTALVSGNTIVWTLGSGVSLAAVNVFYVLGLTVSASTGNVASDGSVAAAAGSSANPSVTSATPTVGGDFFVGMVSGTTLVSSFTQDSTNAAWASPPGQVSTAAPVLGGGNVVNPSATTRTYAPTFGTSDTWAALVGGFFQADLVVTSVAAKYQPSANYYNRFRYNSWDIEPPTAGTEGSIQVVVYDVPRPQLSTAFSNLYERRNSFDVVTDIGNPHFVGRHRPSGTSLAALISLYYWGDSDDTQLSVVATNQQVVGQFKAAALTVNRFLYEGAANDVPSVAAVVETNQHWLGRFSQARAPLGSLYYWGTAEDTQPTTAETNQHFVGWFQAPRLPLAAVIQNLYTNPTPDFPAFETNQHFAASFRPARQYAQFRYNSWSEQPPVAETDTSFIGSFRQATVSINRAFYQREASEDAAVAATNQHWVGRFKTASLAVNRALYSNTGDVQQVSAVETNTNFIGSFRSAAAPLNRSLYQRDAGEDAPVVATNQHWVGRFRASGLTVNRGLYSTTGDALQVSAVETNTHFLARFRPAQAYVLLPYSLTGGDSPIDPGSNTHFVPPFTAVRTTWFGLNSPNTDPTTPQPEAQPHFLGRYRTPRYSIFLYGLDSREQPQVAETQPHFLGKFQTAKYSRFGFEAVDVQGLVQVAETDTNFVGSFKPASLRVNAALRHNTSYDVEVETNQHQIGRFYRPQIALLASLWNNQAEDIVVAPNPHFVGSFRPARYARFNYNSDSCEFPAVAETQPHFLGQFRPARYGRFAFNDGHDATGITPPQPETDTHFVGRFQPVNLHVTVFNGQDHDYAAAEPMVFYSKTKVQAVVTSYTSLV
jgi:hypothetical protein